MSFNGFKKEALMFLFENKMHNDKQWYDSHKDVYKKHVYSPMVDLITELSPTILEIDDRIITVPSRIISRVRRDTRFTKDKTLYRDNAWIVFLRDKSRMSTSPCFWFELGQGGSSYGLGYYKAEAGDMMRMRQMIIDNHPAFAAALDCYESQSEFILGGDMYKRSKYPESPDNLKLWLDRKNIYFECVQNDFELAFSNELTVILKNGFKKLKPIYDFLLMTQA